MIVVTDHAPNTLLETQPTLSRRQARWSEFLQRFKLQWQYRPGRQNVADPISRSPAFVAAVQHGRGADVQLALPAPPLDTFETLGEPIKSGYTNDARFQDVGFIEKHGLAKEGDFWYKDEQIAVPESSGLIGRCMHMLHNPAYCGHLGGNRTYQAVKQFFWWNGMTSCNL